MRVVVLAVAIFGLTFASGPPAVRAEPGPVRSWLGYQPARPLVIPRDKGVPPPKMLANDVQFLLRLALDDQGKVDSIAFADSSSIEFSTWSAPISDHLMSISFDPARRDGTPVRSLLPIKVQVSPQVYSQLLEFPVDTAGKVDLDLFELALHWAGVQPPSIIEFPSYFANVDHSDTTGLVPAVLFAVTLDSTGRLLEVDTVASTAGTFTSQLLSACRYATFAPASINGHPSASSAYLLISLFHELTYPTPPFRPDRLVDSVEPIEAYRIRCFPLLAEEILKPIPRRAPTRSAPATGFGRYFKGTVTVACRFDETGHSIGCRPSALELRLRSQAVKLSRQIRYYAAVSPRLEPTRYADLITFEFRESIVRIDYSWLR